MTHSEDIAKVEEEHLVQGTNQGSHSFDKEKEALTKDGKGAATATEGEMTFPVKGLYKEEEKYNEPPSTRMKDSKEEEVEGPLNNLVV